MIVTLWGTRGSIACSGPETVAYGGNTSCVEVRDRAGTVVVLDGGTGIRRLGAALPPDLARIDLLLSHLHMDHIQGLGFFGPLFRADIEVHIWGPPSTTMPLGARLARYLSPPLFPVRLRELPSRVELHDVPHEPFRIGAFEIRARPVIHPGATVGYRLTEGPRAVAYLPDHEPALGTRAFPGPPEWTSGFDLVEGADVLIHDAQYTAEEYAGRVGWGHSRVSDAVGLARLAGARRLVPFHHDPDHDDRTLDRLVAEARAAAGSVEIVEGREGVRIEL